MRYLAAPLDLRGAVYVIAAVGIIILVDSSNEENLRRLDGLSAVVQPIGVREHAYIPNDQGYQILLKYTGKIDMIRIKL